MHTDGRLFADLGNYINWIPLMHSQALRLALVTHTQFLSQHPYNVPLALTNAEVNFFTTITRKFIT